MGKGIIVFILFVSLAMGYVACQSVKQAKTSVQEVRRHMPSLDQIDG